MFMIFLVSARVFMFSVAFIEYYCHQRFGQRAARGTDLGRGAWKRTPWWTSPIFAVGMVPSTVESRTAGSVFKTLTENGTLSISPLPFLRYSFTFLEFLSYVTDEEEISLPERFTTPLGVRALSLSPTPTPCRSIKRKRRESIDDMCNDLRSFRKFVISACSKFAFSVLTRPGTWSDMQQNESTNFLLRNCGRP